MSEAWDAYTREIARLRKKQRASGLSSTGDSKQEVRANAEKRPVLFKGVGDRAPLPDGVFSPLERNREKTLRHGNISIDARLDLHGKTQIEAYEALASFIKQKFEGGKRNLLIVTGKGSNGGGVLKSRLKDWLASLPESGAILALRQAAPQHGGRGAYYVLLRGPKNMDKRGS